MRQCRAKPVCCSFSFFVSGPLSRLPRAGEGRRVPRRLERGLAAHAKPVCVGCGAPEVAVGDLRPPADKPARFANGREGFSVGRAVQQRTRGAATIDAMPQGEAKDTEAAEAASEQETLRARPAGKTSRTPQYTATIVVDILHFIYGLGIGWSTIALPTLLKGISIAEGSWLTSIMYIVAMFSMPVYSVLCERYGRRLCGFVIGGVYLAGALLQATARTYPFMMLARVLFGVASGGIFVFAPLYVSEIAEDKLRGRLGAFVTLLRNVGILFAYAVGALTTYRNFEYICIAPPLIFLVSFYFLPEAPMYLLRHGKEKQAQKALQWLRGKDADIAPEFEGIKKSLQAMNSAGASSASVKDLFGTRGSRRAVMIGLLMSCNQQLCGFFGVVSYTFMIFNEVSTDMQDVSNVIVGFMLVVGIAVSMLLYDRLNRKVLLLASNALMIPSLLSLSLYFYLKQLGHDVSSVNWVPVTALSVYVIGYGTGAAALPIVILTEIFSPKIRNLGLTTNGLFCWTIIFLLTKTFPDMCKQIGFHGTCLFYVSWCVLGVVVILTILPETRNRKLESILDELEYGKKKAQERATKAKVYENGLQEPIESVPLTEKC